MSKFLERVFDSLSPSSPWFLSRWRITEQNVEASCFREIKLASALADRGKINHFPMMIRKQSSLWPRPRERGYVAKHTPREGQQDFHMVKDFIPSTEQTRFPNLTWRKSWNHYVPWSLDSNKQGLPGKKFSHWKSHPTIPLFSLLPKVPWQHSTGKELTSGFKSNTTIPTVDTS